MLTAAYNNIAGIHIQMISPVKTSIPALLKNLEIFTGDAYTGLQGMKHGLLSKGIKKPMENRPERNEHDDKARKQGKCHRMKEAPCPNTSPYLIP